VTQSCIEQLDRIESMAVYQVPERVLLALLGFAADIGVSRADGAMRIAPHTHEMIAEYVGSSREIATHEMNRLRTLGLVNYSRKSIETCIRLRSWRSFAAGPFLFLGESSPGLTTHSDRPAGNPALGREATMDPCFTKLH